MNKSLLGVINTFNVATIFKYNSCKFKMNKKNLLILKLFRRIGLLSKIFFRDNLIIAKLLYTGNSQVFRKIKLFIKNKIKYTLSLNSLDFFSKNTKSIFLISSDSGVNLSIFKKARKGGFLILMFWN